MELKGYQIKALETFDSWFETFERIQRDNQANFARYKDAGLEPPADLLNFPKHAWQEQVERGQAAGGEHIERQDGMGRPIPHICFKVPTGGGKTLLAASVLERIRYPAGLVLWIVPTRAIYQQTRDALWNREHPYRQRLERASGGRVKMLEKDDRVHRLDIANYLCVMLLMFPAANRQKNKDFLRMFRDSSRYDSFFPDSDDGLFDETLLKTFPDLEAENGIVKHSLFNVIKMQRPAVILDEAHKAYGKRDLERAKQFAASINRLNPRLVLEFSATPNPEISNLLVDITGVELKNEEMIKMPIVVISQMKPNWQDTLAAAVEKLKEIDQAALSLRQREDRYIRPIAVIRVERTGRGQRDGQRIHAEDVRDCLEQNMGVPKAAIRVKSAENDELGREDLLSETSAVRWIITKDALKEGWDCPFAYMLVLLDNTRSQNALAQLVGRVLRQPHARRTGVRELDRCYAFCWDLDVGKAVQQVKNGLEGEGLTGLMNDVESANGKDSGQRWISIPRRKKLRDYPIHIPKVLHREGDGWRKLDHLQDIVADIDWDEVRLTPIQRHWPEAPYMETATVDIGQESVQYSDSQKLEIDKTLHISYFARRLSDIVPNPWRASQFVLEAIEHLQSDGASESDIFDSRAHYADQLRRRLRTESDRLCKVIFERKLKDGIIRFDLRAEKNHAMPKKLPLRIQDGDHTLERAGEPVQLSLFDKVFEKQFDSELEKDFAFHLDKQERLQWWHRVQRDYYLQGWRREKIYPDFVAFGEQCLCIFETKGNHLKNEDTKYKREVFELLERHFNQRKSPVRIEAQKGRFAIVYNSDFPAVSC